MQFSAPRPEPSPCAVEQSYDAYPWQEPERAARFRWSGITLVGTDTTAFQLALEGSQPQGLAPAAAARTPTTSGTCPGAPQHQGSLGDLSIGLEPFRGGS